MDADALRSQLAAALARVAAGDRAALRLVYQDTSAKLFGVCLRILHDRGEAEDVLRSFDPDGSDVMLTVRWGCLRAANLFWGCGRLSAAALLAVCLGS